MKKIVMLSALAAGIIVASPAVARGVGWAGGPPPPPQTGSSGGNTSTSSGGAVKVPEPGMLGLMGAGVAGLILSRRRRKARG